MIAIEKKTTVIEAHRLNFPGVLHVFAQEFRPDFDDRKLVRMIQEFEEDGAKLTQMWHNVIAAQKEHIRKAVKFGRAVLSST